VNFFLMPVAGGEKVLIELWEWNEEQWHG